MFYKSKKLVYIHSEMKISGTTSNFLYNLDLQSTDYDKCVVLGMTIPKSYYNIRDGYNTFVLDEINNIATITIPAANYSRSSLKTTLQGLLNSSSPNGWTYTITIPGATVGDTGKYTFTVSGNSGIQPKFIFTTKMTKQLGFGDNSINEFSGSSLTSTYVIYLQSETVMYLHSDICANNGDNILQECYAVNDQTFSNISWVCPDVMSYSKVITSKSSIINFYLTDEEDNPIDINGTDFHFTLMLYKEENLNKIATDFIKYLLLSN